VIVRKKKRPKKAIEERSVPTVKKNVKTIQPNVSTRLGNWGSYRLDSVRERR